MPEICRFFGIIIFLYPDDHLPPHFHARYAEFEAQISIETGNIIVEDLPKKQIRLVQAWVELHRDELYENWEESKKAIPAFKKIEPIK